MNVNGAQNDMFNPIWRPSLLFSRKETKPIQQLFDENSISNAFIGKQDVTYAALTS